MPASSATTRPAEQDVRRPRTRLAGRVLVRVLAAAFALAAGLVLASNGFIDLQVYRDAGRAYLDGVGLFGEDFESVGGLRFIYGPIAAVAVVPFTLMADALALVVWTSLGVALLWWVLRTVCDRLGQASTSMAALTLLAPALLIGPVRDTIGYGQVNLILMGLVVLDLLGVLPRQLRGVGIGLAAAVKMTPAAFGLVLLVRKDYASAGRAAATFVLASGLGWVLAPADSLVYWTEEFFNTRRGGSPLYGPNQAITGLLARGGLEGSTATLTWLVLSLLVVAAAAYAARRFTVSDEPVLALGVVALATLLVAPLAVSHHWVYVVLLLPLMCAPRYGRWRYGLGAVAAVFFLSMHTFLPQSDLRELEWTPVQQVLGNSEGLVGIGLMIAAVLVARRRRPTAPDHPSGLRSAEGVRGVAHQ